MNINQSYNRVEGDLQQFRAKEERFVKLFSANAVNKVLLKEKLSYYDGVTAKYKASATPEEKFALRLLKQERKQLERKLYPNFFLRLARKMILPIVQNSFAKWDTKQTIQNEQALKETLSKSGFALVNHKIDEHIKQGQREFSVPVSYYKNEKERMDFKLSFAKDDHGRYKFEGYQATLHTEGKLSQSKQQTFNIGEQGALTATQTYNLLAGRAIHLAGPNQNVWKQLDFNDKDAFGNYRMKEFHIDYGYDLKHALLQLPIKELHNRATFNTLMNALLNGSRQEVFILKNGTEQKFFIEANPQFKSMNIYDENLKKVSIAAALGDKTVERMQMTRQIKQQAVQSKGKGLSMA